MNGLAAVQAITSDNEDQTLEGRGAKEIGVLYPIRYMYGIFTYIYHKKNQRHVGKYARDGAFGYNPEP